jgi:putative membrane protein
MNKTKSKLKYRGLIILISVLILVVVVALRFVRIEPIPPLTFLPPIYATINGLTAVILILAYRSILAKNIKRHELLMKISIGLSVVFLVMYVLYHMTTDPTSFGGEGVIKYIYFFILITHVTLSVFIIPMVLVTYVRAISEMFDEHKKIARITFPIWLYIAVTGVIVYLMISPYYN